MTEESFERKILEYLKKHSKGATITTMAKEIESTRGEEVSRNTLRKYIKILIREEQINYRQVGRSKLYYYSLQGLDTEMVFKNYYMHLLRLLWKYIPNKEREIKQIGMEVAESFQMDIDSKKIGMAMNEVLERGIPSLPMIQEILEGFRQYVGLYEESMVVAGLQTRPKEKKIIIRYSNVKLLVGSDDFMYHLYFLLGYLEGLIKGQGIPITINVGEYKSSDDIQETFFEFIVDYSEILK